MAAHSCARPFRFLCQLFVIDGQSRQTVQLQPGGMTRDVLIVALSRDHRAVVAAEFQLRQIDLGPQLLGTIVHQLTRDLSMEEIEKSGFANYYVDHTIGVWPQAAGGVPFNACEFQVKGDIITDLHESMAAEQKARSTYDNILRVVTDYDVCEPIKYLREREIVHYQRFGEALRITQEKLDSKNFYAFNPSFDNGKSVIQPRN